MQYRNIRVEDLTPGAPKASDPTGPFEVSGVGPHTVEVRSIDAAGNVEDQQTFAFEIGETAPPGGRCSRRRCPRRRRARCCRR